MTKYLVVAVLAALTSAFTIRELFPRVVKDVHTIPIMVPKYDTVEVLPDWWADSVKKWKARKVTSERTPVLISSTIVSGAPINVIATPPERSDLWPLLEYHSGSKWGDTAIIGTMSIRSGQRSLSKIFVSGILTGISIDSGHSVPRLDYAKFPDPERPSFLYRLKLLGLGAGVCAIGGKIF